MYANLHVSIESLSHMLSSPLFETCADGCLSEGSPAVAVCNYGSSKEEGGREERGGEERRGEEGRENKDSLPGAKRGASVHECTIPHTPQRTTHLGAKKNRFWTGGPPYGTPIERGDSWLASHPKIIAIHAKLSPHGPKP